MGRLYAITLSQAAITTAIDLFQVEPAADQPVWIRYIEVSQGSDAGDAEAEMQEIEFRNYGTTAITTDASVKWGDNASIAFGGVAKSNQTRVTTGSSLIYASAYNVQVPYIWIPTPELGIFVRGGDLFTVSLPTAPADSITMSGTMIFEEVG